MGLIARVYGNQYTVAPNEDIVEKMKVDLGVDKITVLSFLISTDTPTRVKMNGGYSLYTIYDGNSEIINCPNNSEGIGFIGTDSIIIESGGTVIFNCFYTAS